MIALYARMKHILLVEDDPQIARLLDLHLNTAEYRLITCSSGESAMRQLSLVRVDLIILDIMLPGMNGMEICRRVRQLQIDVPIMMLTSRGEEADKVLALELGADDYVTKPFGVLELMARTKALLRRPGSTVLATPAYTEEVVTHRDLRIDERSRKVTMRDERVELTPKEFDLLLLLARHPGKAFSRKQLLEKVWEISFDGYEHTVTAHINRLRIKIEPDIEHPDYILTAWGIGYRFKE